MTTTTSSGDRVSSVRSLIDFALESLPAMQLEDGAFCFERRAGVSAPMGRSARYTLMVELGLMRAQATGYVFSLDLDELNAVAWRELEQGNLTPGDIGLMLWTDALGERGRGEELASRLSTALEAHGGLGARLGMELGWIVTGLAHHVAARASQRGASLLKDSLDQLLLHNRSPAGLIRHFGDRGWRRRFPNFATQIYSVLALAVVARHDLDDRALPAALAVADQLLATQLPDGGWPWLFDAERGTIVERYEVYSVHQDAMAPMALLELWEVCGDERYAAAAERGLSWIHGANELGVDMIDRQNGLVLRSIRRKAGHDRFWAGLKTVTSLAGLSTTGATARVTEINPTDRPYHFGWVLAAWCGRESRLSRAAATETWSIR